MQGLITSGVPHRIDVLTAVSVVLTCIRVFQSPHVALNWLGLCAELSLTCYIVLTLVEVLPVFAL
jgi:hypothetical protein